MIEVLDLATKYKELLPFLGATIAASCAGFWAVIQFALNNKRERRKQTFESYHQLVKELVEGGGPGGTPRMDRQCAVVYELRFFPRYRPVTRRMLEGLRATWATSLGAQSRLVQEIDLTLKALPERPWDRD